MCGIAAILAFENKSILNKCNLVNMMNEIKHRGPDDEGIYMNNWAAFGFKRLSIIDTSYDGHQPMFDTSKNFIIVFNGEIYNYKSLKDQLLKKNYKFKSNSDTEVLLHSYIEWGDSCFSKLEGMFAFLIYDKLKDEVIAARDHLGIKPLYYYKSREFFLFGSEIKAFKNLINFELNKDQLYEQFLYGYVSDKQTIYKNIFRISPGTFLKFSQKGFISENVYYNVTDNLQIKNHVKLNLKEINEDIDSSILKHTMSDVGYNIQLSGGIDSSYITAALSTKYKQTLNTYSVTIDNFKMDESRYQRIVSRKFNTIHHSYSFGAKELYNNFEKAAWHFDIPIDHAGNVFLMLLCCHSRSNSKVILTGEGSDELFGGYWSFRLRHLLKYETLYFLQQHNILYYLIPDVSRFKDWKAALNHFTIGVDQTSAFSKRKIPFFYNGLNRNLQFRESVVKDINSVVNKVFASFQTSYLNALLERQDKMSMAMGVEARVPFSNRLLFDKMNKIPFTKKLNPVPKAILKRIAEQYFDKTFLYRRKNGFSLPLNKWLRDKNGLKPFLDLLTDKTFRERGFYNSGNINLMIKRHLNNQENNAAHLMNLISFEIWHRMFIDKIEKNHFIRE